MSVVSTIQASGLKKGMNKVVLDVPLVLVPFAIFWGKASGEWNKRLPAIEQQAKAKGLNITMPREGFYMNAAGQTRTRAQGSAKGYQYIERKYYNAQLRKFVIWVRHN